MTETFGPDGGELELADGAVLTVPEGVFEDDTALTITIIDFDYGEQVEAARVYRVVPAEPVAVPGPPLLLTTANLGEYAFALQPRAGAIDFLDYAEDGELTVPISDEPAAQAGGALLRPASANLSDFEVLIVVCTSLLGSFLEEPEPDPEALALYYYCLSLIGSPATCEQAARAARRRPDSRVR